MAKPAQSLSTDMYVPIMKCKMGELGAVALLTAAGRARISPLVELTPDRVTELVTAWADPDNFVYVQPLDFDGLDPTDWADKVSDVFVDLRSSGIPAVPTATPDASNELLAEVGKIVGTDGFGLCIRLDAEDYVLETPGGANAEIQRVLDLVRVDIADADLIIDCGLVRDSSLATRVATAEGVLRVIPRVGDWRTVVVAFSAFPELPGEVAQKDSVTSIPREDAQAFARLIARDQDRDLIYGDYGVGVPFYSDRAFAPIPSIKYAVDDQWLIYRASTRNDPSPQYVDLARQVSGEAFFPGSSFSGGDAYIDSVANGSGGPGNATTYVRAAISRHLAVVVDRLARLGVP